HLGDDEPEHVVAEELEPLIAAGAVLAARQGRDMGQRAIEQRRIAEGITDPQLEFFLGLRFTTHRTVVRSRSQRTAQGQRQTCQARAPSPIEKKMISARPTRFSKGT